MSPAVAPLMAMAAVTLALASAIHFGVTFGFVSDPFPGARIPEAIIAAMLAAGAIAVAARIPGSRWIAAVATGISIVGVLVGVAAVIGGGIRYGDLVYHGCLLVLLVATAIAILLPRAPRRS
jgi:peptidoglycan/LPS O-acetylase OafA/YrhL